MNKIIAMICLMFATAAHAEWIYIQDDDHGGRLLGEKGSLNIHTNNIGTVIGSARFAFVNEQGQMQTPIRGYIAIEDCKTNGGQLRISTEGTETYMQYFWTTNGQKLYDSVAKAICVAVATQQHQRPDSQPQPLQPIPTPQSY